MSADRERRRRRLLLLRRELRCGAPLLALPAAWIGLSLLTAGPGEGRSSLLGGIPLLALVVIGSLAVRLGREWGHLPSRERLLARPVERGEVVGAKLAAGALLLAVAAALLLGALAFASREGAQSPRPPAPRLAPPGR